MQYLSPKSAEISLNTFKHQPEKLQFTKENVEYSTTSSVMLCIKFSPKRNDTNHLQPALLLMCTM